MEFLGSCRIYAGDPTEANGAGMIDLGFLEDVTIDLGSQMAFSSNAQLAGIPDSNSVYALPSNPTIQAQIKDASIEKLQRLVLAGTVVTDDDATALGLGSSFKRIEPDDLPTIAIVADFERGQGSSAPHAIWLPKGLPQGASGFTFNRPQAGEIGNPYNTEFQTAYAEADQSDDPIPEDFRTGFIGDPAAIGLSWSLPTGA